MPKQSVIRSINVSVDTDRVRDRLRTFAGRHGFRASRQTDGTLEYVRGGLLGELLSSDVRKLPTVLGVDLEEADGPSTTVTVLLAARTRFGLFASADRTALEGLVNELGEALDARAS